MEHAPCGPLAVEDARQWLGIRQDDRAEDEALALLIDAVACAIQPYLPYDLRAWCPPSVRQAMLSALKAVYEDRTSPIVTPQVLDMIRPEMRVNV